MITEWQGQTGINHSQMIWFSPGNLFEGQNRQSGDGGETETGSENSMIPPWKKFRRIATNQV